MPIYEFRCHQCGKKFSDLLPIGKESSHSDCPKCGSHDAEKLISRFTRHRSEDDRLDSIADSLDEVGEPDSPAEMRQLVREMGKAMDDDSSSEMEEMFEADMEGDGGDDAEEI